MNICFHTLFSILHQTKKQIDSIFNKELQGISGYEK